MLCAISTHHWETDLYTPPVLGGGGGNESKLTLFQQFFRQEKRAQRLTFWVRRPPGGVGVFHAEGWWPKTSCPPSKVCLPWVSKRGIWDVPGFLPGCPGPLAVFKKFVQKNFVRIFRSLVLTLFRLRFGLFGPPRPRGPGNSFSDSF